MKKLIFTIFLGMVFLSSCQNKSNLLRKKLVRFSKDCTPINIIWYKPGKTGLEQNYNWCDANEMSKIITLLIKAENPALLNDKYQLSIIFYDGRGSLRHWEDRFEIRGGNYLGLSGTSKELGKMFSKYKPEEVGPPIPFGDPNRIKESQKRLQEEAQRRLGEPNLPHSKIWTGYPLPPMDPNM